MSELKKMPVKEFRERGYLQELNRRFLHPLGLALEVVVDFDGNEHLGDVWDDRDDPEGTIFGPDIIDVDKAERIEGEWREKQDVRKERFGYTIQPVGETSLADTEPQMTEIGHDGWRGLFSRRKR